MIDLFYSSNRGLAFELLDTSQVHRLGLTFLFLLVFDSFLKTGILKLSKHFISLNIFDFLLHFLNFLPIVFEMLPENTDLSLQHFHFLPLKRLPIDILILLFSLNDLSLDFIDDVHVGNEILFLKLRRSLLLISIHLIKIELNRFVEQVYVLREVAFV